MGFVSVLFALENDMTLTPILAALQIVAGGICVTVASIAFDRLSGWRNESMAMGRA
jgi:hypothetical protein